MNGIVRVVLTVLVDELVESDVQSSILLLHNAPAAQAG